MIDCVNIAARSGQENECHRMKIDCIGNVSGIKLEMDPANLNPLEPALEFYFSPAQRLVLWLIIH